MRQIVLDTETTGIDPRQGHKVIEIGCVELVDRKLTGENFHVYINPQRNVEEEAVAVHGLTDSFLSDKPIFAIIADEFLSFIKGADLIIHNSPFDVGFLNNELSLLGKNYNGIDKGCSIIDTLVMARGKHPGQKNNLNALCKRYHIDNTHRTFHGALLDSKILAEVYLTMTGGQRSLALSSDELDNVDEEGATIKRLPNNRTPLRVIKASFDELERHKQKIREIKNKAGVCCWSDEI